jgi:hypothetical protein
VQLLDLALPVGLSISANPGIKGACRLLLQLLFPSIEETRSDEPAERAAQMPIGPLPSRRQRSYEKSRPIAAPNCKTSFAVEPSRSRRAISAACSVAGIGSEGAGPGKTAAFAASAPDFAASTSSSSNQLGQATSIVFAEIQHASCRSTPAGV